MKTEKSDNELIAEFMGMKYRKGYGPLTGETYDEVKQTTNANWQTAYFHKSWDWLMPVVEKIEGLGFRTGINFSTANNLHGCTIYNAQADFKDTSIKSKIDVTYRVVIDFIKWYNSQKH